MFADRNENICLGRFLDVNSEIITPALAEQSISEYGSCQPLLSALAADGAANVVLAPGGDAALSIAFGACPPTMPLIAITPAYSAIARLAGQREKISIRASLCCAGQDGALNASEEILAYIGAVCAACAAAASPAVVYISNPDNPLGIIHASSALVAIAERFREHKFVIDESYDGFAPKSERIIFSPNTPKNIVVVRSFSKFHGLAGARVGYLLSTGSLPATDNKSVCAISAAMALRSLTSERAAKCRTTMRDACADARRRFANEINATTAFRAYSAGNTNFVNILVGREAVAYLAARGMRLGGYAVKNMEEAYGADGFVRVSDVPDYAPILAELKSIAGHSSQPPISSHEFYQPLRRLRMLAELFARVSRAFAGTPLGLPILACGSMLGYARYGDILPWDDDIDIIYFATLSDLRAPAILSALTAAGLTAAENRTGAYLQVWAEDLRISSPAGLSDIHVDVFPYVRVGDAMMNADPRFRASKEGECNPVVRLDEMETERVHFTPLRTPALVLRAADAILERDIPGYKRRGCARVGVGATRAAGTYSFDIIR